MDCVASTGDCESEALAGEKRAWRADAWEGAAACAATLSDRSGRDMVKGKE